MVKPTHVVVMVVGLSVCLAGLELVFSRVVHVRVDLWGFITVTQTREIGFNHHYYRKKTMNYLKGV